MLLGKLSLLQMAKDWKIIYQSGHTGWVCPTLHDVIGDAHLDWQRDLGFIQDEFVGAVVEVVGGVDEAGAEAEREKEEAEEAGADGGCKRHSERIERRGLSLFVVRPKQIPLQSVQAGILSIYV